jgi:tartrate dehydratase beta subunit/fumarate hydratase class I family protein
MDFATPQLLKAGIAATLGKGNRSLAVAEACKETGSVYLATTGGAAAYLAGFVSAARLIAWEDLGAEALYRLELNGMPAYVAIDTQGANLYGRCLDDPHERQGEECQGDVSLGTLECQGKRPLDTCGTLDTCDSQKEGGTHE